MTHRKFLNLTLLLFLISGCSTFGTKPVQIVSKPMEIDIMQPALPRPIEMTSPKWYVVSEARITNRCAQIPRLDDKGNQIIKEDGTPSVTRPKVCDKADREYPEWPDNYTYFDQFIDEMKKQNNGDIVFVATTIGDYEVMSANMQEIKRYIKQMGEVIVYYREVTLPNGQKGIGAEIEVKDNKAIKSLNPIKFGLGSDT